MIFQYFILFFYLRKEQVKNKNGKQKQVFGFSTCTCDYFSIKEGNVGINLSQAGFDSLTFKNQSRND